MAELGPSTAGQIEAHLEAEPRGRKGPWWDRSDTKWVAEALFASGVLTTAHRVGFARHYDLTERVLPAEVLEREVDDAEAVRELTLRAATALGVGTEADIRDYFRLGAAAGQTRDRRAGGGRRAGAGRGRRLDRAGLPAGGPERAAAGPRDRAAVPVRPADLLPAAGRAAVRFPLPHRDLHAGARSGSSATTCGRSCSTGELVGRVDLKADRAADALHVVGAFTEDGRDRAQVAAALAAELQTMADWLGLGGVTVGERGDLVAELRRAVLSQLSGMSLSPLES